MNSEEYLDRTRKVLIERIGEHPTDVDEYESLLRDSAITTLCTFLCAFDVAPEEYEVAEFHDINGGAIIVAAFHRQVGLGPEQGKRVISIKYKYKSKDV